MSSARNWLLAIHLILAGNAMSEEKGPLHLSGEQYWNNPLSFKGDIGLDRLDAHADGMLLDAPPAVNLSTHKTIPLVCHRSGDSEKLHVYNLETTTQLVVSNLENGKIQLVKLAESPARRNEPPPSPGWSTDWLEVDLAKQVDLGQKVGRYLVWLACGPEASNERTIELYSDTFKISTQPYLDKIQSIRKGGIQKNEPPASFDFHHTQVKSTESKEMEWVLGQEKGPHGEGRLRIRFRIAGLPGFLIPAQEMKSDPDGRPIYGHIPMLVFGFGKNRLLTLKSLVDLPIVEKPEGPSDHRILSGDISFHLPSLEKPGIRDEPLDVWAVALDHRAYLQFKAAHPK
jgi:hypothetical protein